jgi:hypothetical protein
MFRNIYSRIKIETQEKDRKETKGVERENFHAQWHTSSMVKRMGVSGI